MTTKVTLLLHRKSTSIVEVAEFYQLLIKQRFAFSTDSRHIDPGCIFFALKGENFNGNKYALDAIKNGAAYAVVDEEIGESNQLIKVDNVLAFFQQVAAFHRRCFDIPVLAIAGSNGKTTTKNLIEVVLKSKYKTHCTKGNFNNHIGVPITLLQMPVDTEMAIIEIGTNNPGEIAELCQLVQPNYGLITNIGKEHLEGFGTLEAVAKEESELYAWLLKHDGFAFVNEDDEWLTRMARTLNKRTYSKSSCTINELVPTIKFTYRQQEFTSPLMGDYNLDNILTSVAIGEHFAVDLASIATAVANYIPENNRSQIIEANSTIIWLDAYNANPTSMEAAIANFSEMKNEKKVLILGDMFEMGDAAKQEHDSLLKYLKQFNFTKVFLLGDTFESVAAANNELAFESMDELLGALKTFSFENTSVLVKGSRGMKMERVLPALGVEG